jgi:hypothetical protein
LSSPKLLSDGVALAQEIAVTPRQYSDGKRIALLAAKRRPMFHMVGTADSKKMGKKIL